MCVCMQVCCEIASVSCRKPCAAARRGMPGRLVPRAAALPGHPLRMRLRGAYGPAHQLRAALGVWDDLDDALLVARGHHAVGGQVQRQARAVKRALEQAQHLQRQHVLAAVVPHLEDEGARRLTPAQPPCPLAAEGSQDGALGGRLRGTWGGGRGRSGGATQVPAAGQGCQAAEQAPLAAALQTHLHGRRAFRQQLQHAAVGVGGDVQVVPRQLHLTQELYRRRLALVLRWGRAGEVQGGRSHTGEGAAAACALRRALPGFLFCAAAHRPLLPHTRPTIAVLRL